MQPNPQNQEIGLQSSGVELIEARLRKRAYSPHRHDTYTIAVTTAGVQSFHYHGNEWRSLPGQLMILHPGEVHDGYCSDEAGFSYRAVHLPPAHLQSVIGRAALTLPG